MRQTLTHRGPDDSGLHIGDGIGLAHRRLSIVDVERGRQPMQSEDGRTVLVFNGEIYNHRALRPDLERRGYRYRTRCDTETLLHLVSDEGASCVRRLRGMFAFAAWNEDRRELLLARDRLGIKPLYYAVHHDGTLCFGSEIKAILESDVVDPALDVRSLPDYLANHAASGPATLFEGVQRLPPGHILRWRDGRISIERYWTLRYDHRARAASSDTELIEEFAHRFREAVRVRLMSDVPLGAFLSGGIDSATITGVMSSFIDEPVRTFSVAFAEREANELEYARLAARTYGTEHRDIVIDPDQFFGALPRLVWHEDEPLAHPSSVALYFVAELASRHVKVVLTGEGSDELLGGYGRYWKTLYNQALGRRYRQLTSAALRSRVRRLIERMPGPDTVRNKLRRTFLCLSPDLESIYLDNFAVFSRRRQHALLAPSMRERLGRIDPYAFMRALLDDADELESLNMLLYLDMHTYLHELLMKQDQMSMAASVESRVPFLDHELVEFAARLPRRMKLRGRTTKYILRQAFRDMLPEPILSRGKAGFPVPIGTWFRARYRPIVDDYVLAERTLGRGVFDAAAIERLAREHQSGAVDHSERLWALVNLELWHRLFIDREPREAVGRTLLAVAAT